MQIELSDTGDLAHRAAILAPLAAHNQASTGIVDKGATLAVFLRDATGAVEGGMWAKLWYNWMKIEFAFLPAHRRGQRLGARILSTLETAAVAHGAVGIWVESFNFQAPGFYEKLGYRTVGKLTDRPVGHANSYLVKTDGFGRDGAELVVTTAPEQADIDAIGAGLSAFNDAVAGPSNRRSLALLVRDDAGAILGGLWGRSGRGWLFIDLLGLPPELRRSGMGTRLMRMAEDEARKRGCVGIYLDTFTFQARPFYEKLGYAVFAQIDGYPGDHTRFFLSKRLDA